MIQNYFKIALRNLVKYRVFSLINILGLAAGLACFLLLALYVKDELGYDRFHANAERIYRLSRTFLSKDGTTSLRLAHAAPPFGPKIKQDFPQVEEVVRMLATSALIKHGENQFDEPNIFAAEPSIFKIFSFQILSGNPENALNNPFSIMLSKPMAEKYFGRSNPVGQTLRVDNQIDYTVTGVFEPLPKQSHFHPQFLVSFSSLQDARVYGDEKLRTDWGNNSFSTFLLLKRNVNPKQLVDAFPAFQNRHVDPKASTWSVLGLMKLTDIHLYSQLDSEIEANGNIQYVYLFSIIGFFILLIACINYMNLATARSATRAREVGMRKVIGAMRSQLIYQFMCESALIVSIAVTLAVSLVVVCLPAFNNFTRKALTLASLYDPAFLSIILGITLFTALIAGSYPAFFMTALQPIATLKGKLVSTVKNGRLRHTLVVTQFAIAVTLIISTLVVYNQINYIQKHDLGYSKDQVVLLRTPRDTAVNFENIREQLLQNPGITQVARSSRIPTSRLLDSWEAFVPKNNEMTESSVVIKSLSVDEHFIPAYEIKMVAGRNFSKDFPTDKSNGFVLNETAARKLGWTNPREAIGNRFGYGDIRGQIIGVTKDFHFESLHQKVVPLVMFQQSNYMGRVSVRISGQNIPQTLAHIEQVMLRANPEASFSYQFLDQRFGDLYVREQTQQLLFGIFAGVAVVISCMGLLGLSMFMAALRTKEIGVRKVLGASVTGVIVLLSRDFLKPVLVAIVIASPIAWYVMNRWLEDFAYHTEINWWTFAFAGIIAVLIAILTVSSQGIRAALINPVESLRSE